MSGTADRPEIVAIVGPTGVGKTLLAEDTALALGGQIVSADSMQVYRGMDIGTDKPLPPHRVPYHCIDLVEPDERYSAVRYQEDARRAIEKIRAQGDLPVVSGGTGLYVRAALDEWEMPSGHAGTPERERLEQDARKLGAQEMHRRLREVDPEAAELIHPHNTRRVVRALEMAQRGTSYAEQAARFSERHSRYDTSIIGLTRDRQQLYERIDARVDRMMEGGLLEEVAGLLDRGLRDALTAAQAIGYKELVPVIEDAAPIEGAVAAIKQATRRYAKRQLTWFRADQRVRWLDITDLARSDAAEALLELVSSSASWTERAPWTSPSSR